MKLRNNVGDRDKRQRERQTKEAMEALKTIASMVLKLLIPLRNHFSVSLPKMGCIS